MTAHAAQSFMDSFSLSETSSSRALNISETSSVCCWLVPSHGSKTGVGELTSASFTASGEKTSAYSVRLSVQLAPDAACIAAFIVCLRRKNKEIQSLIFDRCLKLARTIYSEIRCQIISPFSCCALTVVVRSLFPGHELSERQRPQSRPCLDGG